MNTPMTTSPTKASADDSASAMHDRPRILVVDDDPIVAESIAEFLRLDGFNCATACDGEEALQMLAAASESNSPQPSNPAGTNGKLRLVGHHAQSFGVVVADVSMPRCDGMELLRRLRKSHPTVVPIIITGFGKIEQAVEAVKLGATDYLTKPVVDDELRISVDKALRQHLLIAENQTLKAQLTQRFGMDNIVGADYRMQKVYDLIEAVAESKTTVLIEGESGTGKTMIARAIHTSSPRRTGPFVTFACGSIPETLLESELFGHVKGAFTGADADKPGKILAADGGTLFIDEINSATAALQLKLLRVLQERQFEPVGGHRTLQVDVRFILATNQSLPGLVRKGLFREDLYYRINVVSIQLPALRQRLGDIGLLANHFLAKYCAELHKERKLSDEAIEALQHYHWPGNVRELENAIERAVVLSRRPTIDPVDLPETVQAAAEGQLPTTISPSLTITTQGSGTAVNGDDQPWQPMPLEQALLEPERRILLTALRANGWNRQETARQLNINRTTLYKKIKQFNLEQAG